MSRSDAEITARLRQQYPEGTVMENGVSRPMDASEYDAWIARQVVAEQAALLEQTKADDLASQREKARALLEALRLGTATTRQMQQVLAFLLRREVEP